MSEQLKIVGGIRNDLHTGNGPRAVRSAFTLIELLVVVAIVVVLIAILMPSLGDARRNAKMAVCASNVRQIALGMMVYATEYNSTLPGNATVAQGAVYTDVGTRNSLYGPPILVRHGMAVPKSLYSPDSTVYAGGDENASFAANADVWAALPASDPCTPAWRVKISYVFREPLFVRNGTTYTTWQSVNPKQTDPAYGYRYMPPLKTSEAEAIVSDAFTSNYFFSFHGGSVVTAKSIFLPSNGKGWHVGYVDGHVTLQKLTAGNLPSPQSFGNRFAMWTYWDNNK